LGWLLVLGVITLAVSFPISYSILKLPFWALEWLVESSPFSISFYTCVMASTYIDGRFGLVLPATAVGNRSNPFQSWRYTAGNGWPLFVALMIPILVTELIGYLLFDLLLDTESLIVGTLAGVLYYPVIAIGIAVITVAYRELMLPPDNDTTI
jgi:hypothetical protein